MRKKGTRYPGVRYHGEGLYYRVILANGKRVEIRFGRGTAKEAFLAREERQELENRIKAGLADPRQYEIEKHASRPVVELLNEYLDHMRAKGDSKRHIDNTAAFAHEGIQICNVKRVLDLDAQRMNRWLSDLSLSARSKNARRTAILAFCRWAADYGRSPRNPIPSGLVPRFDENADRRRLSRSMTQQESRVLFEALLIPARVPRRRAAKRRRVFYLVAANTGLRWREIARLRWTDLDLDMGIVIVPAGQTKSGKQAELPLVPQVVEALREIRPKDAAETDKVFSGEPRLKTWKRDLQRAGLIGPNEEGYHDERGRHLDRKCLRMSFCTWLKDAGVDLRDAQKLMRHSDPKLTSNIYTDIRLKDLRSAVEKIQSGEETKRPFQQQSTG